MNEIAALTHAYEPGSQMWFEKGSGFSRCGRLRNYGCGVIAAADYCIYREIAEKPGSRDGYLEFAEGLEKSPLWVVPGFGMSSILYPRLMNMLLRRRRTMERMRGKSVFFYTKRAYARLENLMREQLSADFPVILMIGSLPPWLKKRKGVTFYRLIGEELKPSSSHVYSHFVTATGMYTAPDETVYLKICSWGDVYYLSLREYLKSAKYTLPFSSRVYYTKLKKNGRDRV